MSYCINTVFKCLPPQRHKPPARENLQAAQVHLQAFVINVAGCLDNLAWICVEEFGIRDKKGLPLARKRVGFRKANIDVRAAVPPAFVAYLVEIEDWMDMQENFRDALAHRIPLYVPPYSVLQSEVETHSALQQELMLAEFRSAPDEQVRRLRAEVNRLRFFHAMITHSFSEPARPIVFHAQLIADFRTVEELTKRLFAVL